MGGDLFFLKAHEADTFKDDSYKVQPLAMFPTEAQGQGVVLPVPGGRVISVRLYGISGHSSIYQLVRVDNGGQGFPDGNAIITHVGRQVASLRETALYENCPGKLLLG